MHPRAQADFVSEPIKQFTQKGVDTADGTLHELDVVFLATGSSLSIFPPPHSH